MVVGGGSIFLHKKYLRGDLKNVRDCQIERWEESISGSKEYVAEDGKPGGHVRRKHKGLVAWAM